jgi:PPK2 family polyphosphate:nucleotide phosphotransferase
MGKLRKFLSRYRVDNGKKFRLSQIDPADVHGITDRDRAEALLAEGVERLQDLQEKLYAQNRWSLLLVFQAMDAAGKDGTVKHVMSGVNPQGCQIYSFKAPSREELDHDFLWRTTKALPERGRIGIFNRSYYEEVLVVRVHRELLDRQNLPPSLVTKRLWQERFESINAHERHLARNGTIIRKFFLHISKDEQLRRFLSRLDEPEKHWKFELGDARERQHWDDYMDAYEDMIRRTATPEGPWFVVPADNKWFARLVVASAVIDALEELELAFPEVDEARRAELAEARAELIAANGGVPPPEKRKNGSREEKGKKKRR